MARGARTGRSAGLPGLRRGELDRHPPAQCPPRPGRHELNRRHSTMADSGDWDRRWFKRFGRRDGPADLRLWCFHHAGGSASMYRHWPRLLPPPIEPVAVQLPGRADRFGEPAFDRMAPLVDELVEVLKPLLDRPFACYGVSMGSRVAWTLSHVLRAR